MTRARRFSSTWTGTLILLATVCGLTCLWMLQNGSDQIVIFIHTEPTVQELSQVILAQQRIIDNLTAHPRVVYQCADDKSKIQYPRYASDDLTDIVMDTNDECGDTSSTDAVILVHTAADHFTRRERFRQAYANYSNTRPHRLKVVFLIGSVLNASLHIQLEMENRDHGDTVVGGFLDTYQNLTLKINSVQMADSEGSNSERQPESAGLLSDSGNTKVVDDFSREANVEGLPHPEEDENELSAPENILAKLSLQSFKSGKESHSGVGGLLLNAAQMLENRQDQVESREDMLGSQADVVENREGVVERPSTSNETQSQKSLPDIRVELITGDLITCRSRNSECVNIDEILSDCVANSPEIQSIIGMVRRTLDEKNVMSRLEEVNSKNLTQAEAQVVVKNIINGVLSSLQERSLRVSFPLNDDDEEFLHTAVLNSIFAQEVAMFVQTIIEGTAKALQFPNKKISTVTPWSKHPLVGGDKTKFDSKETSSGASYETTQENATAGYNRFTPESSLGLIRKYIESDPSRKNSLSVRSDSNIHSSASSTSRLCAPQGFSPNIHPSDYVAIPALFRLPAYQRQLFPRCGKPPSSATKNTIKIGHVSVTAPTFCMTEALTQIHSKLTKHYNTALPLRE